MQKLKILICALLFIPYLGAAQKSSILVGPEWLEERMKGDNLVIFHIGRESDFKEEHIPGAIYLSSDDSWPECKSLHQFHYLHHSSQEDLSGLRW